MKNIRDFEGVSPKIADSAFIDESSVITGNVTIGDDSSVWPCCSVRGDIQTITIGKRTNIQDGINAGEDGTLVLVSNGVYLVTSQIDLQQGITVQSVNGYSKTYEHEKVTIINEKEKLGHRFSFKGGPDCRIVFDSVRLWDCEE